MPENITYLFNIQCYHHDPQFSSSTHFTLYELYCMPGYLVCVFEAVCMHSEIVAFVYCGSDVGAFFIFH